ncbi:MAG: glycosyl transferase [Candidatus Parcubacteria bacterium]|nr:MAG: glycosyl transferase [Candidatus Parcubacteria bacterium]
MENNKKILIFLHKFPYPPTDSTKIRIFYAVIEYLKKIADLEFLIVTYEKPKEEDIKFLEEYGKVNIFSFSKIKFILNAFRGFFTTRPFQTEMFYFDKVFNLFKNLILEADAAYVHTIRLGKYLEKLDQKERRKILLDYNDSIALHYLTGWKYYPHIFKIIFLLEGLKTIKYEKKLLGVLNNFSVVSERDKNFILKDANLKKSINFYVTLLNFIKEENMDKRTDLLNDLKEKYLVFVGNLKYYPNYDAINYFCKNIWPEIIKQIPDLRFIIIGRGGEKLKSKFKNLKNIEFLGFVSDIKGYIQNSFAFISPVRIGAGIQGKILEAMSYGKVVLALKDGFEDTNLFKDKENIILIKENKPNYWIESLKYLLDNPKIKKGIEENAKILSENNFSTEKIGGIYLMIFKNILRI